jgi:hypothetical protein
MSTALALLPTTDAADAGEPRPAARTLDERQQATTRILALLARGAGVTQILKQAPPRHATPGQRLAVGSTLRGILWIALLTGRAPAGVKNTRRDLERTIAYLDLRLAKLVAHLAAGEFANIVWPPVRPMAIDEYGAAIDIRDGQPSLTVLGSNGHEKHDVCAVLLHMLGDLCPDSRVTVNLPPGWAPDMAHMTELRRTILCTHRANQPLVVHPADRA